MPGNWGIAWLRTATAGTQLERRKRTPWVGAPGERLRPCLSWVYSHPKFIFQPVFSLIQQHSISTGSCGEEWVLPRLQGRKEECLVRHPMIGRSFRHYTIVYSSNWFSKLHKLEPKDRLSGFNSIYLLPPLQPTRSTFFLPISSAEFSESTAPLCSFFLNTVRQLGWIQFFCDAGELLFIIIGGWDCGRWIRYKSG